jgi:hypothetical protein
VKQRSGSNKFIEINDNNAFQLSSILREIKTGKTCRGIKQERGRDRQRERDLGREGEKHGGERKWCGSFKKMAWVDFDLWSKSTKPEYFLKTSINRTMGCGCQSRIGWFLTFFG